MWAISFVAVVVRSASLRTSSATTAKPRPASPARAASMAAFRARRLVWSAMTLMSTRGASVSLTGPAAGGGGEGAIAGCLEVGLRQLEVGHRLTRLDCNPVHGVRDRRRSARDLLHARRRGGGRSGLLEG